MQIYKRKIQDMKIFLFCRVLSFTAWFRPLWLLNVVKVLYKLSDIEFLIRLYDPNVIRKRINYHFKEKVVVVKLKQGGNLFVDINDHIGWHVFMIGFWDNIVLEISQMLDLGESDIILDIGANVGAASIPVATLLGVEVIGVEAYDLNSRLFLKNSNLNSVKSTLHQVAAVSPAVANSNRFVKLYENNGNHGSNSLIQDWNPSITAGKAHYAAAATLDSLLSRPQLNQIKLIKIDIEGSEYEALLGFTYLHHICAPIIFEYRIDVGSKKIKDAIKKFALSLSFRFDLYGVKADKGYFDFVDFKFENTYQNAIALPPSISTEFRLMYPHLFKQNRSP